MVAAVMVALALEIVTGILIEMFADCAGAQAG